MANITRIKAKDPAKPAPQETEVFSKKETRLIKDAKKAEKRAKKEQSEKKPFVLFRPFVALGRYLRDSWRELRQVRWPNRKATWKMVLAVFIYTLVFVVFLMLLDLLFDFVFSKILG